MNESLSDAAEWTLARALSFVEKQHEWWPDGPQTPDGRVPGTSYWVSTILASEIERLTEALQAAERERNEYRDLWEGGRDNTNDFEARAKAAEIARDDAIAALESERVERGKAETDLERAMIAVEKANELCETATVGWQAEMDKRESVEAREAKLRDEDAMTRKIAHVLVSRYGAKVSEETDEQARVIARGALKETPDG
jgi:hypothetical protein